MKLKRLLLIIGGLGALVVLIAGFATAGSSDAPFVAIMAVLDVGPGGPQHRKPPF